MKKFFSGIWKEKWRRTEIDSADHIPAPVFFLPTKIGDKSPGISHIDIWSEIANQNVSNL